MGGINQVNRAIPYPGRDTTLDAYIQEIEAEAGGDVSGLITRIVNLETSAVELNSKINDLNSRVELLESTTGTIDTTVRYLRNDVTSLQDKTPFDISTATVDPRTFGLEVGIPRFVNVSPASTLNICGISNSSMGFISRISDTTFYLQLNTVEDGTAAVYDCRWDSVNLWVSIKI